MEILNNIWVALTTENQMLTKVIGLPFVIIEAIVFMLLFTSVLNIRTTKKQKTLYVIFSSILGILCSILIPKPYSNVITLVLIPISIMYIFKVNLFKSICAEFIPVICITVLEIIITRLFLILFGCSYEMCANIPIYRLLSTSLIYLSLFILYKLALHYHFSINLLDNMSKNNKRVVLTNVLFALIVIFMQMYLIGYYNDKLPSFIIIINILSLIAYFILSIYSMIKTMKLQKTETDLEQEKLYNKTLQILHDNIRAFKHDFSNIISGIGGYVETNDMNGLTKYYKQLLQDCNQVSNLATLSPDVVNSPPIYAVLANKYYSADSLGIKITLESFIDFNKLNMDIYEFTRILGILMDNAIEAASECETKLINVTIRNDQRQNRQLLIINNTYKNKNINIDKLSEKGFTTKSNNAGLGLWEVDKILKKHKNIAKFTTKNDDFFTQQIEIYNE